MGAKHKKTRKEKITADYRHQVYTLKNNDLPINNPTAIVTTSENTYFNVNIKRDVAKTGILTLIIIALQIILLYLLQKHIIALPMVKY